MRIAVDHRTHYRFTEPQARIVQLLRLTPTDAQGQTVVNWMVGVSCDARLRHSEDGLGNAVTMLYAEGPIEALDITVTGEVLTSDMGGIVGGSNEPLSPLVYLRPTDRTTAGGQLAEFAADTLALDEDPLERLHRLNAALHARFPLAPDAADTGRSAEQAFTGSAPTSRDVAQMFIAAARSLEVPARYVSGYRSDGAAHTAPHAWAEAHVPKLGWVGFDPAVGLCPDDSYVRVAVGLDAAGAAAVAGTRVGFGKEELDVDLQVGQLGKEG